MSFNVDDPLAGILSDGSDDSFFDDDILGKKKTAKKKSTPTAEKKSALFDLGDIDKPKPVSVGSSVDKKELIFDVDAKKSPTPFKRAEASKESLTFSQGDSKPKAGFDKLGPSKSPAKAKLSTSADKIDILSDLIEPKTSKSIEKGKSSQSLLDDILGGSSTKTGGSSQAARPVTAAKSQDFDIESILGKGEAKTVSTKSLPQKQIVKDKDVKDKKDDTPARKTKSSEDWLGIFQDKEEDDDFEDDSGMPSWLVGGDAKKKKPEQKKSASKPEPVKETVREEPDHGQVEERPTVEVRRDVEPVIENVTKMLPSSSVLQGSNEDITAEGAALYLQQQESQIMVALQLKAQEEKLAAMQMRQKESQRVQREAAQAQHAQLDAMLRRQAENRLQMQTIIASHQERITQRIKALLGTENVETEEGVINNEEFQSGDRKETPHTREKKQLLQLVQSLQENHDKEIDLMETSYRRQLAFLEVSLNQSEERMKEESDKLVRFYTEKINWLEEHHHLYKKLTEDNLTSLTERHKAENEMLREQHLENVRVLQEHHAALMENIKSAVKQEQVLIQDSAGFSSDLRELVSDVRENKLHCQELVERVQALAENAERKTDSSLQVREAQINEMIQHLKKERENFETEKSENRETVKMLEARLKQMTTMIEEESATLKQKRMEFEFEKATFNKQTEFAKNVLKKQDEEIKMLREEIQKEYQDKITKIDEEKTKAVKESATLAREKSTVLNLKQDLEKMKAELQAQLEEVTEERSKLSVDKQQLHMEEQRILAKSRDLDLLAKTAIEKQSQAEKKYSEAEFIQRKYEERIRRIQEHVVSLNAREKQIAREKVTLSRERLALHNERKQIESRQQCSLCKTSQNIPFYEASYTLPESFINAPVTREYRSSNVTSAMNAIEQEMAHLMGRNLNLRHSAAMGDLSHHEDRFEDDVQERQAQDATQVQSGTFKDYMDPKFMMLRLDVQKVLSNLDQSKKEGTDFLPDDDNEEN
ncbi:fas-binding factor 1 twitchy [Anticarsia gemmatalis]|uniref:fas-binding factor 1 twitchy n=1 Tax=Anticarsia gemmatalis TaxID=129554 RepID=UPI003F75BA4F